MKFLKEWFYNLKETDYDPDLLHSLRIIVLHTDTNILM
jgi:hypothetical protein